MKHEERPVKHPSAFSPSVLIPTVLLSVFAAIIGMQVIISLGVSANTSVIGALFAILISRIPIQACMQFRSLDRQNLLQTSVSAATFGAANSLLTPMGVAIALGKPELVMPLLLGATMAMVIDATMLYKVFNSKVFPASGPWPMGVATAETIWAGDQGGKKGLFLGGGILSGIVGAKIGSILSIFGITLVIPYFNITVTSLPMAAAGIALIGNVLSLAMFGIGMIIRGNSQLWFGVDLFAIHMPQGLMIGAGVVSLLQIIYFLVFKRQSKQDEGPVVIDNIKYEIDTDNKKFTGAISRGFIAYSVGAVIIAVVSGIIYDMSILRIIGFIVFAAVAGLLTELIVGLAAMNAGWFPAFAVGLIKLMIGQLLGFPMIPLAVLAGYLLAIGPAYADMGFDLKTGYMLRSKYSREYEMQGRKQQYIAGLIGFVVAAGCVLIFHNTYFSQGLYPPVSGVFAKTIEAASSPEVVYALAKWSILGAIVQLLGGKRQLGIMLGTGLLISSTLSGLVVLLTLVIRLIIKTTSKKNHTDVISAFAGGMIAGDAITSFISSTAAALSKPKV